MSEQLNRTTTPPETLCDHKALPSASCGDSIPETSSIAASSNPHSQSPLLLKDDEEKPPRSSSAHKTSLDWQPFGSTYLPPQQSGNGGPSAPDVDADIVQDELDANNVAGTHKAHYDLLPSASYSPPDTSYPSFPTTDQTHSSSYSSSAHQDKTKTILPYCELDGVYSGDGFFGFASFHDNHEARLFEREIEDEFDEMPRLEGYDDDDDDEKGTEHDNDDNEDADHLNESSFHTAEDESIFDDNSGITSFDQSVEDYILHFSNEAGITSEVTTNAETEGASHAGDSSIYGQAGTTHSEAQTIGYSEVATDWDLLAQHIAPSLAYDGADAMDTAPNQPDQSPYLSMEHAFAEANMIEADIISDPSWDAIFNVMIPGNFLPAIAPAPAPAPQYMFFEVDDELDDNAEPQYVLMDQERNEFFAEFCNYMYVMHRVDPSNSKYKIGAAGSRIGLLKRPEEVTSKELESNGGDIQGIDWNLLECDRQRARTLRNSRYRNSVNLMLPSQVARIRYMLPDSRQYFGLHRMDPTVKVWYTLFQLRNLLSATSKNDVFYGSYRKLYRYDPYGRTNEIVFEVRDDTNSHGEYPRITTMAAAHGIVVAGTYCGDYAIKALDAPVNSRHTEGQITDSENGITNHIHVFASRHSGNPHAVFSSNDGVVRVLDCYRDEFVSERHFDYPINCSATSPDSRLRAVIGDAKEVLILDAEKGDTLHTLPGHEDYGFACAWSDDGYTIATANQDMMTRIYDARNLSSAVTTIDAEMACVRALRFSPVGSGPRVLAMSEQSDHVHIVDAVDWKSRQHIDTFGEICGMGFTPDGRELFVANCDPHVGGLMHFERRGQGKMSGMNGDVGVFSDEDEPWLGRRRKRMGMGHDSLYPT